MAKNVQNPQEAVVAEAVSKTETFFENNGKKVVIALVALVLLVAGGYTYKTLVVDRNAERAAELIVEAQNRFSVENPDFALALNGDESGAGFLDVVEQYGSTPSGNLAKHYAGICYLRLGDLENAEKYLAQYSAVEGLPGEVLNAQNLGLRGDVAVEKGDLKGAVALFTKAAKASDNNYTAPLYLYKKVLALAALGDKAGAEECYKSLKAQYPNASESREAEKVLGTL
ncbi:MAG: tetratricopeptide repeat protein [Alistipes sp.]|nr:tetratricopeptide repeat protein [Alistipes sp.]